MTGDRLVPTGEASAAGASVCYPAVCFFDGRANPLNDPRQTKVHNKVVLNILNINVTSCSVPPRVLGMLESLRKHRSRMHPSEAQQPHNTKHKKFALASLEGTTLNTIPKPLGCCYSGCLARKVPESREAILAGQHGARRCIVWHPTLCLPGRRRPEMSTLTL